MLNIYLLILHDSLYFVYSKVSLLVPYETMVEMKYYLSLKALLSGGVDSTVCAALLHKAIGAERVVAVHIDNGFLRKDESTQVEESLTRIGLKPKGICIFMQSCKKYRSSGSRLPAIILGKQKLFQLDLDEN